MFCVAQFKARLIAEPRVAWTARTLIMTFFVKYLLVANPALFWGFCLASVAGMVAIKCCSVNLAMCSSMAGQDLHFCVQNVDLQ